MEIKKVTVIGAGVMGKQIALLSAIQGFQVVLNDASGEALTAAEKWKNDYLFGRIAKCKMTEKQVEEIKQRFFIENDLAEAVKDADLVIEAIIEKLDIKRELFEKLGKLAKEEAILASNSSFIPSSNVADVTGRPEKVANLHYFNPALVMQLVEVVKGEHTSEETGAALVKFATDCGKYPILLQKEIDGFVVNRIQRAITDTAFYLVEHGYATPQEIDLAAEKGLNYPMGPFRLLDLAGNDIAYLSRQRRYEETGDEAEKPPKFLEEKYLKGELGKKTGKGWYDYSEEKK